MLAELSLEPECRRGHGAVAQMIPGWPYSFVVALEPGRTSWTLPLDAVRLGPADDATEITAAQVREVVTGIITAGHWNDAVRPCADGAYAVGCPR
jgi:hypothetical protein